MTNTVRNGRGGRRHSTGGHPTDERYDREQHGGGPPFLHDVQVVQDHPAVRPTRRARQPPRAGHENPSVRRPALIARPVPARLLPLAKRSRAVNASADVAAPPARRTQWPANVGEQLGDLASPVLLGECIPFGSTNMISLRGQNIAAVNRNSQAMNPAAAAATYHRSRRLRHVRAVAARLHQHDRGAQRREVVARASGDRGNSRARSSEAGASRRRSGRASRSRPRPHPKDIIARPDEHDKHDPRQSDTGHSSTSPWFSSPCGHDL